MKKRPPWCFRVVPHALVLAFLCVGCASQEHVVDPTSADPSTDILADRATINQLQESRYAKEVALELARAQQWLDDVDRRVADGDGDGDTAQLTLVAVRTQLAAIKSFYMRREAQDALEAARAGYANDRGAIRSLENENRQLEQ